MQIYCDYPQKIRKYYFEILQFIKSEIKNFDEDTDLNEINKIVREYDLTNYNDIEAKDIYEINCKLLENDKIEKRSRDFITYHNNEALRRKFKLNWHVSTSSKAILAHKVGFWIIYLLQEIVQLNTKYVIEDWEPIENQTIEIPLPTFIYKPSMIFDRIKAQDGNFLYQLNIKKRSRSQDIVGTKNFECYILPKQIPYKTIKVQNKIKIMKELDNIGINRKNLFQDHDNIAKYLIEKNLNMNW
ncbi:hypothetical protein STP_0076 [Streptococcus parauberis KCTC 11537]|nr:hypothetical protein STP_0076 [Streptococcus parauberis KCTC 11537]